MTAIFSRAWDTWLRLAMVLLALGVLVTAAMAMALVESDFTTRKGFAPQQPVPFSHQHHVAELGIDCRYCHTAVETSPVAGYPPTGTCMTCHSQIWTDAGVLDPVRESWAQNRPLRWVRVHDLADFVYFDHAVHVSAGVGCVACHGAVERMPLMAKARELDMAFCLACHRDPGPHLRPRKHVFDARWTPPDGHRENGRARAQAQGIDRRDLTHCNVCHR